MTLRRGSYLLAGCARSVAVLLFSLVRHPGSVRAVYTSPSGNYHLVVHNSQRLFSLPGDSTGSAGYVELFDRFGNKLGEAMIPLVLEVSSPDDVRWYNHHVSVPGAFDFPIPGP